MGKQRRPGLPSSFANGGWEQLQELKAYLSCRQRHEAASRQATEAWQQFYPAAESLLRRYARSSGLRAADIDDCVQVAWKEITQALPSFRHDAQAGKLFSWLRSVVHTKALDIQRYRARHPTVALTRHVQAMQPAKDDTPVLYVSRQAETARIERVLEQIRRAASPMSYSVFELRLIDRQSVRAVAERLNLTADQVRARCCRMKQKFRAVYQAVSEQDARKPR